MRVGAFMQILGLALGWTRLPSPAQRSTAHLCSVSVICTGGPRGYPSLQALLQVRSSLVDPAAWGTATPLQRKTSTLSPNHPPMGSQSSSDEEMGRPRLVVMWNPPPPGMRTTVLTVTSKPRPGEVAPEDQLPDFANGVEGWLFRHLGEAAKEVMVARALVHFPLAAPELRTDLAIPYQLRPQVEALIGDGRVSLAPGPWTQDTLASWEAEDPVGVKKNDWDRLECGVTYSRLTQHTLSQAHVRKEREQVLQLLL